MTDKRYQRCSVEGKFGILDTHPHRNRIIATSSHEGVIQRIVDALNAVEYSEDAASAYHAERSARERHEFDSRWDAKAA